MGLRPMRPVTDAAAALPIRNTLVGTDVTCGCSYLRQQSKTVFSAHSGIRAHPARRTGIGRLMAHAFSFSNWQPAANDHAASPKLRRAEAGFTVVEMLIVAAVILITTALAAPLLANAIAGYKLRTAAMDLDTLMQRARIQAVRDNRYHTMQSTTVTIGSNTYTKLYVDLNSNATFDSGEPSIQLGKNVTMPTSGAPSGLSSSLGFSAQPSTVAVSFNGRGTPCVVRNGVCGSWDSNGTEVGFIYYVRSAGVTGTNWAAVTVSPSGRFRVWSYDSHSGVWSN